jgi:hypothetical protein
MNGIVHERRRFPKKRGSTDPPKSADPLVHVLLIPWTASNLWLMPAVLPCPARRSVWHSRRAPNLACTRFREVHHRALASIRFREGHRPRPRLHPVAVATGARSRRRSGSRHLRSSPWPTATRTWARALVPAYRRAPAGPPLATAKVAGSSLMPAPPASICSTSPPLPSFVAPYRLFPNFVQIIAI